MSSSKITLLADQLRAAELSGPRAAPKRASEAVETVRGDRMTSRTAAKTPDIFVGSLQKRVSDGASKADGVGPGTVVRLSDEK